ncbi:unnamed protein product [Miscanthus lutarioriparius]|uniref:ABC transporter domain-containing protein n=1 Tax=Miscanthus lutarioriparius TaxID=422564 RepID=A0A811PYM0_9POAL|nr:unnamed protein product [Miscanthus lutarioriparius]
MEEDSRRVDTVRMGNNPDGSLLRASSSWCASRGSNAFWSSAREEDDEEVLRWAAIEKLPTYDRMRKGILTAVGAGMQEVDIQELSMQERKCLIQRLIRIPVEDNERVGIQNPTIEVRFEHLTIHTEPWEKGLSNFFSSSAPDCCELFLSQYALTALHVISSGKRPISILHDISGIVRSNRMSLLLGAPGSGKTSLLLALAGKLDSTLKVSGRVTYNGHDMDEFVPQSTSAYIGQHDVHIGEMTVRETLAFAARCQGVGTRYDMLTELSRREKQAKIRPDPDIDVYMKEGQENFVTDYILKILGLDICADIMVGDSMIRGEMLVGPANTLFMDEISTGLDSSTTYQIVNSLRQSVHILGGTALISLLQPAPETYELFDDIILLAEGQIVYQGPRENVIEFFEATGFRCPDRKGVADFLQEVTSRKDQYQYWCRRDEPYRYVSVNEFVATFKVFHVGNALGLELEVPFDRTKNHPAALTTSKFSISRMELLKACFSREWLLMKRNSFIYIIKVVQLMILGTIAMTVFPRTKMHRHSVEDGVIFLGAMFLGLVTHLFNGFVEVAMSIAKLPIFYKQRDHLFYPSWAYALPTWLLKIPISFLECAMWTGMTYYVIGFDPSIERFFRHYLLLVLISQMASGLFRLLAAVGRDMVVAETFGSFAQIALLILGGFLIARNNIKTSWIWGYWSSPLMYAQNAIAVNEFLGNSWQVDKTENNGTLGVQILKARGIFVEPNWYWVGVGALLGYIMIFNLLFVLFLDWLGPLRKCQTIVSEEELREKHVNRTGENVELLPLGTDCQNSPSDGSGEITRADTKKRGMVLPFTPLTITFDNIKYSVDMPQEMKDKGITEDRLLLLKGVSGAFRPGALTALMGVSGAGKMTLLDVLAGRKTSGYIEGDIYISGWLMFVEEVAKLVELMPLRGALVGLPGVDGLSTEQRKRLTIAVELVANPSIIFMDEPTSGLDARAAAIVMRTVRNTVDTGRTVVCTIHQPSIDIFEAFDELFLLKREGEEIYVGPLGHKSCHLIKYFEGVRGVKKIKDGYNPATWMLEVTTLAQEDILGCNFAEVYRNSDLYRGKRDLFDALGSMYATVLLIGVQNGLTVQPIAEVERTVFYREKAAGMYSALPYAFAQRIPIRWIWYSWTCPVAWTLYGLVASQFGDITDVKLEDGEIVKDFINRFFGFTHDHLGYAATAVVGFTVLFSFMFAFSIKVFNF